ncbi:ATP-binding protein [Planctobacterium marinum]|uniref:ATP-binding protein n=1 Tax=Planctobacterium marinum TaxID=1631968 RepID=UPI001E5BE6BD|nr:ATP-binding protein [Planctobacterium marinum]MCC2606979.1 ATP-binding protein [Planctobacterium marinum]
MPGLQRIILIDTHLPGRVELKLQGHTNICGTNASGKTTLQRLIPVFYGESPSRVVPATRDSFERWYLPRESSFIIYEYVQHEDNVCQLVLSSNGTGVQYRLVAKPFVLEDYVFESKPGEFTSLTMSELGRQFKKQNILVSNLMNNKAFRGVIQNDRTLMNSCPDSRDLIGYARMFSLCASSQHMRHIEKLARAVHSKEGKMETIKTMIGAILEEDGVQPPVSSLKPGHVENWIRECRLIQEFDAIRPEFGKLQETEQQLQQTELRLGAIQVQIDQDVAILAANLVKLKDKLEGLIAENKVADAQWQQLRDELNQQLSEAKADTQKFERDLQQIEDEYDNWQEQDIETLQQNLQQLPQWLDEQSTLSGRYALLTEKHQDIEATYNRRIAEMSEKLSAQLDELGEAQLVQSEHKAQLKSDQQLALQNIQSQCRDEIHDLKDSYAAQKAILKIQETEANTRLQSAGFSEFEQNQLELQDAAIKEASEAEDTVRHKLSGIEQQLESQQKSRNSIDAELQEVRKQYQNKEQELKRIEGLLYPGNHSLLEYLRAEMPDWQEKLGKVIQPELLNRTDLKPHFSQSSDELFGLKLDLSSLALPEYAQSEVALRETLETIQSALSQLSEQQSEVEQRLSKASEAIRELELDKAKLKAQLNTAQSNRQRAQQDKEHLLAEYRQALSERKLNSKKALKQVQDKLNKLNQAEAEAIDELKERQAQQELEHKFHWQQLIDASEEKIQQLKQQMASAKRQAEEDKKACQQFLEDEMAKRGVDVDEIGSLKKQLEQLKKDIQHTQNNKHKIEEYQRWYKNVFTGQKVQWQQKLTQAKKQQADAQRHLEQEQQSYQAARQARKESQTDTEQQLRTQQEQHDNAKRIHKALVKLPLPKVNDSEALGMAGSVAQRISESDELLAAFSSLSDAVKHHVEHFDHLIAAQSGTGLSDIWEHAREACTYRAEQGAPVVEYRKLVTHLDQLLNEVVPQKLNGLKEQGRIFGADLTQYFHVLADIDKRILGQSKRISREVDEELFLDGVSDSAVKIRSRITELEFWPELTRFNELHQQWMSTGADKLPDEVYGASMRQVLDILGRAALSGGISRLLDIELRLREGNSDLVIRTDRQLNESSSHGMAYLILCKFLLAFTRLLRGHSQATVHWPIDELGTLHHNNVKKIFDACEKNNIHVLGAFPNPDSDVLALFENRYIIDKAKRRLQVVQPKVSAISQKLHEKAKNALRMTEQTMAGTDNQTNAGQATEETQA